MSGSVVDGVDVDVVGVGGGVYVEGDVSSLDAFSNSRFSQAYRSGHFRKFLWPP